MRARAKGDFIPTVEEYRGVGIHDFQPRERIERVVKPAIDTAFEIGDGPALLTYARTAQHPPEARLLAATRIEAIGSWPPRTGRPGRR